MTITHPPAANHSDSQPRAITTTRFGVLACDPSQVFACAEGIPGFGDLGGLAVLPVDADALFVWLQSTALADVAFLAVNPWPFFVEYEMEISDRVRHELGIEEAGDVVVFCLARPDEQRRQFHVNLLAPVVGSTRTRTMRQITLDGDHPIAAPLQLPDLSSPTRPKIHTGADHRVTAELQAIGREIRS